MSIFSRFMFQMAYAQTIILFLFTLGACTSNTTKESTTQNQVKSEKKKGISKPKQSSSKPTVVPLNNENLERELLAYGRENPDSLVVLTTRFGKMTIRLYKNTPLHRANFVRLVKNDFYKDTEFYRVVKDFIVQGGDNDDWERSSVKSRMGSYTLPAEIKPENFHKRGAIAMARDYDNNPEKRSSPFDFYFVQGLVYTPSEIRGTSAAYDLTITPLQAASYTTVGGCPHLDGQHTVFGEVIDGVEVIDSIASVRIGQGDWPLDKVEIKLEMAK